MRRLLGFVLILAGGGAWAEGPTFDCAKADHDAELAVCNSAALASLDVEMARLYGLALNGPNMSPDWEDRLKATQRGWIKGRNDCWKSSWPMETCVAYEYARRIDDLRRDYSDARAEAGPSVGPFAYQCDGFDAGIGATFVNTEAPLVVLRWEVVTIILDQVEAASGAKYTADNWIDPQNNAEGLSMFWTKGDTAQFQFAGGPVMSCQKDETG